MKKSRLLWRIYLYFLLSTLAALAVTTWYTVNSFQHFHNEEIAHNLHIRAQLIGQQIARYPLNEQTENIAALCNELGRLTDNRITVILPGGSVIGDSDQDPELMDNHAGRPEIISALQGNVGESSRFSGTFKRMMKYVALPVWRNGALIAVVRVSQPLADIRWSQQVLKKQFIFGGLATAIIFALVTLYLSRRITRPLEGMQRTALQLADGDLKARIFVSTHDEFGTLAATLNQMAEQLSERMETITRQHVEQHAVLTCMTEGVLAVDSEGCVLYLNTAAANLLHVTAEEVRGQSVEVVIRHHELQQFILSTLNNEDTCETELALHSPEERHIQLHGTPLKERGGHPMGGLVVLNDITRIKRIEAVRSDFVANVSHELKTPIMALKGCIETLSSEPPPDATATAQFMKMMGRHTKRLEAIVEDLLSLSRIEFDEAGDRPNYEAVAVNSVIHRVAQTFAKAAETKQMALLTTCPENLTARINEALLEQAIGNLVDNAIKYSREKTTVRIDVAAAEDELTIQVSDQGPGIAQTQLPRIFERFYRVDQARSRALGGTGLGLSIVKHIALAHRGRVSVQSTLTKGSTFTLHLPK